MTLKNKGGQLPQDQPATAQNNIKSEAVNSHEHLEKELKLRLRQQAAIAELGQRALVGTTLAILMEETVRLVNQTLNLEYSAIFERLPEEKTLLLKAGNGWQKGRVGHVTINITDSTFAGYVLNLNNPVVFEDLKEESRFTASPLFRTHAIVSGMSVIVQSKDRVFGILGAYTRRYRLFSEDDVHFLQAMANVLAMAIERKQTETEIVQRNRELLILQSAGAAITSSLDLQYVLNAITEKMTTLLGVDTGAIYDWNETDDTVSLLAKYSSNTTINYKSTKNAYSLSDHPLTRQVLTRQYVAQITVSQPVIAPGTLLFMNKHGFKSLLMMPIVFQGRAVGLVEIMDSRTEHTFTDQQIGMAKLLINQAASAIENARLHTETRRMLKEQQALRDAGAVISSTLDLEAVLNHIAEQMGQALDVTSAYICDFEAATGRSAVLAQYTGPQAHTQEQVTSVGTIYNMAQDFPGSIECLQAGQPEITHAGTPNLSEIERTRMQQFAIQTTLLIPMQVGGQIIGYANLHESRRRREFSHQEITLGQDIAQQAAIAIENARLFEQTGQALEETEALYRVARTSAQIDNEPEIYELVLTEYLQSLNLPQGGVVIIDDDGEYGLLKTQVVNNKIVEPGLHVPVAGNPMYEQLIRDMQPVIIHDIRQQSLPEPVLELTLKLNIKSMLLVPIMRQGEVIGALGADSTEDVHTFTSREIALGKAMANQLSIALENLRLKAETEQRAEQLSVLHELDRAITTSLRLSDIYYAFARHVSRLLTYDRISIAQIDGQNIRVAYVVDNTSGDTLLPVGTILPRQTSAAGWVITQRQPMIRHNMATDNRFVEDEQFISSGIQSCMIIPLRTKGEVVGTWNIESCQVGAYTPDDLKVAQAMADQLAIAIDNARLYTEIQQYLEELTTLNMISQAITSTLDLEEMLTIITQHTVQLAGVEAASVVLYDEAKESLWFAAASGKYGDVVRGKALEIGQGIVGWVMQHQEPVMISDVATDQRFFSKFDQSSDFKTTSVLCVPLQNKGQAIGAIEAINKTGGMFDQEDLRLLLSLAAPAATAIETARLFELAQQELAERKRAEAALEEERALLARRVEERTADLRAVNQELARASRLKDEFLASMSHELRTPLTAILGLSEVLRSMVYGPLNEKQVNSIQDIESSGRHLLALINDILDLSKIEAGQLELQIGPVAVENVCQSSMQFIKQTAHRKHLKVSFTMDSRVSMMQADERRLKQVLVNLLSNAVKFTPENGAVGLEVVGNTQDRLAHFIVWDTGIGISEEDMARLFQPFVQLDSSLSRQHAGTGLGLALVSRMVNLHNGTISVESEVNKGSRFTVSLPWGEPTHLAGSPNTLDALAQENLAVIERVLIIDDSPTTADKLTRYLHQLGITTIVYPRGEGAVQKAIDTEPDLIILDIILSDASGWDILPLLKEDPATKHIPVLVISAMDARSKGLKLGAADYLVKPISIIDLQDALSKIVVTENKKQAAALPTLSTRNEQSDFTNLPLVLVAEDEGQILNLLVDYLQAHNYQIVVARNGLQAVEQAKKECPDIILMDIQMPEMDGLQAIKHIRNIDELAATPIIALTALAMPGDKERCLAAGASGYISKPVNLQHLISTIKDQLVQNQNYKED